MPSIEDRIVRIEFDNKNFENEVNTTLQSLADLEKGLKFTGAETGVRNLAGIASSVDHIASRFTALGAVAFTVIQSLTTNLLGIAKNLAGDFLGPVISGGTQRAKNIEQAKFMFEGLGISVEEGMKSALDAVKGTAFGLDEAAKAAAQFGASGIKVGAQMTGALRGVAGAAAMTGSSFTEMADIFAGSAGTGKVTNMDLMQFATRGLNAAAAIGKVLGKTEAQVHEMAASGKLDFQTFANAMDAAFGSHATEANKTFTGALANMHAAMSRLGAAFIAPQLTQQRDLFNALTPVIDNLNAALTPLVWTFTAITGTMNQGLIQNLGKISFDNLKAAMPDITKGISNLFETFQKIVSIGKEAFRNIFPAGTVSIIGKIAEGFRKFTEALILAGPTVDKIKSIFQGLFSILSIGWTIIKEGAKFIFELGRSLVALSGGDFLTFAAKIGDFFTALQEGLVKGGGIQAFFEGLTVILQKPISWLGKLKEAIGRLFGTFDDKKAEVVQDVTGRISDRFESLHRVLDNIKDAWKPFMNFMHRVGDILAKTWEVISGFFADLGGKIADVMSSGDFSNVLDALNTGIFATLTAAIIHWFRSGFNIKFGLSGGFFDNIAKSFDQLTGVLQALQVKIKSEALMKIAIAIGVLTASVVVLSLIDSVALTKALTAMAIGFAQLMGAFAILTKLTLNPKTAASFGILSIGMIALGAAILILSFAAKNMADLNWDELARGLTGTLILIGLLVISSKLLSKQAGGMIRAGVGISALSVGLLLMSAAVKVFASMSWGELTKGLIGLAVGLGLIVAAMILMPPHMALLGLGLVGVGLGLVAMATALKLFGDLSWDEIGRGLVALAGGLALIAAAMYAMPDGMILIGIGLNIVGAGLVIFARALKSMGAMSWEEISRGLVALGGSLLILAIGVGLMTSSLAGAAALVIVSSALLVLAGVLKIFGKMGWDDLLEGLGKLAVALAAIAIAALILEPAIPAIIGLGVALGILGLAFALFGAGAMMVAKAFELIAKVGKVSAESLNGTFEALVEAIPAFARGVAAGMLETLQTFADGFASLIPAIAKIIDGMLTAIQMNLPKVIEIFNQLLDAAINQIYIYGPQFIAAGFFLLITFLQGLRDNIEAIATLVVEIISTFINTLAEPANVALIVGAGTNLLIALISGVVDNVNRIITAVATIITTFLTGLAQNIERIVNAGVDFVLAIMRGISKAVVRLADSAFEVVIGFIRELRKVIDRKSPELMDQGVHLIGAVLNGITGGLAKKGVEVLKSIGDFGGQMLDALSSPFDLGSPSKVTTQYGEWIAEGFAIGLDRDRSAEIAANDLMNRTADAFKSSLSMVSDGLNYLDEFNPVITPVLDLTKVAEDSALIAGYIQTSQKIAPNVSMNQARVIASTANEVPASTSGNTPGETSGVTFVQTINSPTQLATADIYKQTRNQITIAKEELAIP